MRENDSSVRVHDALTYMGWISGKEAHALAYWTMRLAQEIEGVSKYVVRYRALREMSWENVRPLSTTENAISVAYPRLVSAFLSRYQSRFATKHQQSLTEIRRHLDAVSRPSSADARKAA